MYRAGTLLVCLLLAAAPLVGLEKTIELGKEQLWQDALSLDGVASVTGRWGLQDLALAGGSPEPDTATECLLHFDAPDLVDATTAYTITGSSAVVSTSISAVGPGSAGFTGLKQGLTLQGPKTGMFATGAVWGDFTIEFWLYPATLSDGESILSWSGSVKNGGSQLASQILRCSLKGRRLVWELLNLFTLPGGERLPVSLTGTTKLLPRVWRHHLLRYDSRTGTLEYQLDGQPEAIIHLTDTGSETGSAAVAMVGQAYAGPLVLGQGFTGFLDELRISRQHAAPAAGSRYQGRTGTVTFRIIDLGFSSTRIARIDAVTSTPGDSGLQFYYQTADTWNGRNLLGGDWVPFSPGTDFGDGLTARFLQIRVELYPDGTRTQSPRLSSLSIVYEPNIPPAAPAGLVATPGNGKVTLAWRRVNDLDVKGYMVYYGSGPGSYLGTGASQGDSPIDAGTATTIEIGGLENGTLYYFAVVAYDDSVPRQQSAFSTEASARPSRLYK
jgi:hypothetical protein